MTESLPCNSMMVALGYSQALIFSGVHENKLLMITLLVQQHWSFSHKNSASANIPSQTRVLHHHDRADRWHVYHWLLELCTSTGAWKVLSMFASGTFPPNVCSIISSQKWCKCAPPIEMKFFPINLVCIFFLLQMLNRTSVPNRSVEMVRAKQRVVPLLPWG